MYTVEAARTDEQAIGDRAEWWRQRVTELQAPMTIRIDDDFTGRLSYQRSDDYQLVYWQSDAEHIERGRRDVRLHPHGSVELFIPRRGTIGVQQGEQQSIIAPGQMLLACLDQPFEFRHGDGVTGIGFQISTDRIDSRMPQWRSATGVLNANAGMARITADLIVNLRRQSDQLSGGDFDAIADRIVDLLALSWTADTACRSENVRDALLTSIRRFVRANAHDPDLTGERIAARLGWSLRHIQVQLQRAGTTPSELIRHERLSLARLRLQDPGWASKSVTQIAFASGFGDLGTFSNAYRRAYGERPSDSRG